VRTLVLLAVAGSAVGLLEQWAPLALNEASRPAGLFASRTTAGVFVASALPLMLGFRFGRRRWVEALALLVSAAFVVSTASRAAWLAAALAAGFVLLRRRRVRWKAIALAGGVIVGLVATPGPQLKWHADDPYLDALSSAGAAAQGRWPTWRAAMAAIAVQPLLGWGPGQFAAVGPRFTAPEEVRMEEPHNEWLRLGFEAGLLGVGAAAFAVYRLTRRRARHPALWASLGVLALAACTGKTFLEPPTMAQGAVLAGLCFSIPRRAGPRLAGILAWGVVLGCAVLADATQLIGSRQLQLARRAAAEGRSRNALELAERADPFDGEVPLFAAELAFQSGDETLCRAWVARGLKNQPDSCELANACKEAAACPSRPTQVKR